MDMDSLSLSISCNIEKSHTLALKLEPTISREIGR